MNEKTLTLPTMKLVGIQCRTNNKTEMTADGKIPLLWQKFYSQVDAKSISHLTHPEKVLAVYKDYESDHRGDYTLFIGYEVSQFQNTPPSLMTCEIAEQKYLQFTSQKGAFPNVVIELWQKIWNWSELKLNTERAYQADIEVYDQRSQDPLNAQIDILISI